MNINHSDSSIATPNSRSSEGAIRARVINQKVRHTTQNRYPPFPARTGASLTSQSPGSEQPSSHKGSLAMMWPLKKQPQTKKIGDYSEYDGTDAHPLQQNCKICDAAFAIKETYNSIPARPPMETKPDKLVILYYIKNEDKITYKTNDELEAGVNISLTADLGAKLGGKKGGVTERTETFRKTVVAAEITFQKGSRGLILDGMRCVNCLCSLDGILSDRDRVKVFNTVQNILRSNELRLVETFAPSKEITIGLMPKNWIEGYLGLKYNGCHCGEKSGEEHKTTLKEGNERVDGNIRIAPLLLADEVWSLHVTEKGDGRTLLKNRSAGRRCEKTKGKSFFLAYEKPADNKPDKVCLKTLDEEIGIYDMVTAWEIEPAIGEQEELDLVDKKVMELIEGMSQKKAISFYVTLHVDSGQFSDESEHFDPQYLAAMDDRKVKTITDPMDDKAKWVMILSLPRVICAHAGSGTTRSGTTGGGTTGSGTTDTK